MQTAFGIGPAMPDKSIRQLDYASLITSGMLYDTLASIEIIGEH